MNPLSHTPGDLLTNPSRGTLTTFNRRELMVLACAVGFCFAMLGLATALSPNDPVLLFLTPGMTILCVAALVLSLLQQRLWSHVGHAPPLSLVAALALFYAALVVPPLAVAGALFIERFTQAAPLLTGNEPLLVTIGLLLAPLLETVWRHWHVSSLQAQLDAQTRRANVADYERRMAEARLQLLQAQIEPHFLFNTLASIQYLVRSDAQSADFMLSEFIRYLRDSMPSLRESTSTLGKEFSLVKSYLNIARIRNGGRLVFTVVLPDELRDEPFPPLMLQTLAENALKHGVEPKMGHALITLSAEHLELADARYIVRVSVSDDGVGLGGAPTAGGGAGLRNVRERLAALFGDKARLRIESVPTGGVLASIDIERDARAS